MKYTIGIVLLLVLLFFAWKWYQQPRIVNGEGVIPFSITLADGQVITEKSFGGKYLLLHFWGSWCGPCRVENPDLQKLKVKYAKTKFDNAEGLAILHLGVERSQESWKAAIIQDGMQEDLNWSDFSYFDNELAQKYGVREIPSLFLINPDGVIVAARQSVLELDRFLAGKMK
ncbi:MAG: TlpA disulfide reductase family protein [Saprospiraceae bacterium]